MDRRLPLDGLRAVAILTVVLYHAAGRLFPGGWSGVDVFFVLSGFLITTALRREIEETGRISFSNFFARRALRLGPALALLLLFEIIRSFFASNASEILEATLVAGAYVMNWSRSFNLFPQDVLGHTWSLSAEEQFYLIWPFALALVFRRGAVRWVAAAVVAATAWRIALALAGSGADRIYNGFDTHCDGLLIGCLLGLVGVAACREKIAGWGRFGPRLLRPSHPAALLALIVLLIPFGAAMCAFGLTLAAACSAWLLIAVHENNWLARLLSSSPLVYTGKISYGFYLWHYPALSLAHRVRVAGWRQHLLVLAVIAGTYAIAALSYAYVEEPFLLRKRRFEAKLEPSESGRPTHPILQTAPT